MIQTRDTHNPLAPCFRPAPFLLRPAHSSNHTYQQTPDRKRRELKVVKSRKKFWGCRWKYVDLQRQTTAATGPAAILTLKIIGDKQYETNHSKNATNQGSSDGMRQGTVRHRLEDLATSQRTHSETSRSHPGSISLDNDESRSSTGDHLGNDVPTVRRTIERAGEGSR